MPAAAAASLAPPAAGSTAPPRPHERAGAVAPATAHRRLVGICIEAFGAGKGEEDYSHCTYNELGNHDVKNLKTLRMTILRRRGCCGPGLTRVVGGAINTPLLARFCNRFLQIVFSAGFASMKCMYVCKLLQICFSEMLRFRKFSQL